MKRRLVHRLLALALCILTVCPPSSGLLPPIPICPCLASSRIARGSGCSALRTVSGDRSSEVLSAYSHGQVIVGDANGAGGRTIRGLFASCDIEQGSTIATVATEGNAIGTSFRLLDDDP
eukprot:CAMPEP_0172080834 /NCGR_PEP_ID=MMETSP1043-20130122/18969_1 /TAXON_ID=464988 /ORGANISM="Hemiselmis andersenii, Strain CCMP441" /LENGTH=119 /DNA_ID=CAMNT_0012742213 /DNA_START=14 /DNA_END=369 /DNA_ORIENTATION=+